MSPRLVLICLALLVLAVYAPLSTSAAPYELNNAALPENGIDTELGPTAAPFSSEPVKQQQRTLFLLLPVLFPNQYY